MNTQNHWIALYLSGQYPGHYRLPNRFDIILKSRAFDSVTFSDSMISLLRDKSDTEFYNTLLETYQNLHGLEAYENLLNILKIPKEVRKSPFQLEGDSDTSIDLKKIDFFLKHASEEELSRFLIMPILNAMGYEDVEYKGKVNETDFGVDFYVTKYSSPGGITHYAGVQVKKTKMSDGDTSQSGTELNKLIAESITAFSQPHRINTGEEVYITELLVMNSSTVIPSAKDKFFKNIALKDKKIKYWARDGLLSLVMKLDFKKDFFKDIDNYIENPPNYKLISE